MEKIRFYIAIGAIIFFGVGTFPSVHGVLFWLLGSACVAILYNWKKFHDLGKS